MWTKNRNAPIPAEGGRLCGVENAKAATGGANGFSFQARMHDGLTCRMGNGITCHMRTGKMQGGMVHRGPVSYGL